VNEHKGWHRRIFKSAHR